MAGQNDQSDSNYPGAWWTLMTPLSGGEKMTKSSHQPPSGMRLKSDCSQAWGP